MLAAQPAGSKKPKKISWEAFSARYLNREDGYKYEWVNGMVEKTPRTMDKTQLYILDNLLEFLFRLKVAKLVDGNLIAEGDAFFAGNHRRPDIAYYSKKQIQDARQNKDVHPDFVVEVISKKDQMVKVLDKMGDYRRAGVKVIWHIFPKQQEIHIYQGKKMTICTGDDLCSAEAVVEGFVLPAREVFK